VLGYFIFKQADVQYDEVKDTWCFVLVECSASYVVLFLQKLILTVLIEAENFTASQKVERVYLKVLTGDEKRSDRGQLKLFRGHVGSL